METKLDLLAVLAALLGWLSPGRLPGFNSAAGAEDNKQKIIGMFHAMFSKVDEGIWTTLLSKLNEEGGKRLKAINRLLTYLNQYGEVDSFRGAVVNAPAALKSSVVELDIVDPADKSKTKKIKQIFRSDEFSDSDARVVFLMMIADLVDDPAWGPEAVRDMLRSHKLATEHKAAKVALGLWKGFQTFLIESVCALFGVKTLNEITPGMIVKMIDAQATKAAGHINEAAAKIPVDIDTQLKGNLLARQSQKHPARAGLLAIGIVIAIAFIALMMFK